MSLAMPTGRIHADQRDEYGRPMHRVTSTNTPSVAAAGAGTAERRADANVADRASADDWYRRLGESHRRRDDAARREARTIQDRHDARELACRRRWPAV